MNNQLTNIASASGTYNDIPTAITSSASVVNLITGLTLTKTADKENWVDGNLTYTIKIENQAQYPYTTPVITDVIDTSLVTLIEDSITIDGVKATEDQYSYDSDTHTLTVTLTDVAPTESKEVVFQVKKNA